VEAGGIVSRIGAGHILQVENLESDRIYEEMIGKHAPEANVKPSLAILEGWRVVPIVTLMVALSLSTPVASAQTTIYVSPHGDDTWSGSAAARDGISERGPFATVQRAQQEIRRLKSRGELEHPVTVYLRGGTYELAEPIVFTSEDSGLPNSPITYTNVPGEEPLLSGGTRIDGWQYYGDGLWSVELPEVARGEWHFDQLFVEGARRQRARIPNEGYLRIEALLHGTNFRLGTDRFRYREGDIDPNWTNLTDVKVVVFHHWLDVHLPIREVDAANRVVTFQMTTHFNVIDRDRRMARYVVENVFEGLDSPGEWYLNRKTGTLFYMPLEGEIPSEVGISAPRLTEMVVFDGEPDAWVENITLRGLRFEHNQWEPTERPEGTGEVSPAAIALQGSRHVRIDGCTFRNLGTYAIQVAGASDHNTISSNLMEHLGGGGIRIGGDGPWGHSAWRTTDNSIVDNTLRHLGELYPSSRGIFIMQAARTLVAHNEISYLRYNPIQMGYFWGYGETATHDNVVEYNHIHHVGHLDHQLGDLGAVYMVSEMPGSILRNNLIHDITGTHFAFGIYLDNYASHLTVENNVVFNTQDAGFIHIIGKDNEARNNVFAFADLRQVYVGPTMRQAEWSENLSFERNIVIWRDAPLLDGDPTAEHIHLDRNTYHRVDGEPVLFGTETLSQWRQRGHDIESVIANPLVELNETGFSIDPSSPAIPLGFRPIDLSSVGPRTSPDEDPPSTRRRTTRRPSASAGSGE
jgi:hypothetical protein